MAEDTAKKWQCLEILGNTSMSSMQKKGQLTELLTRIAGGDCPVEALSLIMGRNYNLCQEQMETLQDLVDTLGDDSKEIKKLNGLKHTELVSLLIDCNIIVISMKLFEAQMGKWNELANCGKDSPSGVNMTTCLIRIRFDCLLITSFLCNNNLCSPTSSNGQLFKLCQSQLLTSNAYTLLTSAVENDPSVVISYYSLMLLDNLLDRYYTKSVFDEGGYKFNLIKLGHHLIKDTLSTKMYAWLREGHASDTEKQYLVCLSDDGSLKDCWRMPSEKRCTPQAVRISVLKWSSFTFNHCAQAITHLIGLHPNRKILRAFISDEKTIKSVVKWTRTIPIRPEDLDRVKNSVKVIVSLVDEYEAFGDLLFEDAEFMESLRLGVCHADSTLATYFMMCIGGMAKKNATARKKLTNEKGLVKAIVRSCCSAHSEMQTVGIFTLFNLVDRFTANKIVKTGFSVRILKFLHKVYHSSDNVSTILVNLRCRLERYTNSGRNSNESPNRMDYMSPFAMMAKKVEGNQLYKNKQYQEAADLYTKVLDCCPPIPPPRASPSKKLEITDPEWYTFPAALFSNRAQCYLSLKNYDKTIADCNDAIVRCDPDCAEARTLLLKSTLRRSTAYFEKEMWTQALLDAGFCLSEDPRNSAFVIHFFKVFKKYRQMVGTDHLVKRCVVCLLGEGEKLKRCANCTERYCSRQCQLKAWDEGHRDECTNTEKKL